MRLVNTACSPAGRGLAPPGLKHWSVCLCVRSISKAAPPAQCWFRALGPGRPMPACGYLTSQGGVSIVDSRGWVHKASLASPGYLISCNITTIPSKREGLPRGCKPARGLTTPASEKRSLWKSGWGETYHQSDCCEGLRKREVVAWARMMAEQMEGRAWAW